MNSSSRRSTGRTLTRFSCALALLILAFGPSPARASVPTEPPVFSDPLEITNEYFPFQPGAMKVFRGKAGGTRVVTTHTYLSTTRAFVWAGGSVETRVLREIDFEDGVLKEESLNYFAQADDGTVYYFGEVVDEYVGGDLVSHGGSWLVGGPTDPTDPAETATAAMPTIYMPANPEVGDKFKPEDLYPIVDETVTILEVTNKLTVEAGKFKHLLKVRETSLIEGSGPEKKWIAGGVGVIRSKGEGEKLALISTSLRQKEPPE